MDALLNPVWLLATAREAVPLILAVLAAALACRAGLVDYAIDGKLLLGAFVAAATGAAGGSLTTALLAAAVVGLALALLQARVCMVRGGDAVVTGIGLGLLAAGATGLLARARWWPDGGLPAGPPAIWRLGEPADGASGFPMGELAQWVRAAVPAWGVAEMGWLLALALAGLLAIGVAAVLQHTRSGLRLRAAGAQPAMAEAAGLPVLRIRLWAMAVNGLMSGAAGALLWLASAGVFSPGMSAGRGLLALAAALAARRHPLAAVALAVVLAGLLATADPQVALLWGHTGAAAAWRLNLLQALPFAAALAMLALWRSPGPPAR